MVVFTLVEDRKQGRVGLGDDMAAGATIPGLERPGFEGCFALVEETDETVGAVDPGEGPERDLGPFPAVELAERLGHGQLSDPVVGDSVLQVPLRRTAVLDPKGITFLGAKLDGDGSSRSSSIGLSESAAIMRSNIGCLPPIR